MRIVFLTEHGYFVLLQADYLSSTNILIENVAFYICQKHLSVIPRLMIRLLKNNEYQLVANIEKEKDFLNKFVVMSVALKGDAVFYERWFKARSRE